MEKYVLEAKKREVIGKQVKALRREGLLPAVIYGSDIEPMPLTLNTNEVRQILSVVGANTLITIIDEGDFGVLTIPPWIDGDEPQAPIANKLYNRNGSLYWGTHQLALSSSSGWTDDGTIVRLRGGADNVGIGTTSPTEKFIVSI